MSGKAKWQLEIETNIKSIIADIQKLQNEKHELKLDINTSELDRAIKNLNKVLDSLGNGTGSFKSFEKMSKQLNSIISEVRSLNKAFGSINGSGMNELLVSVQSIDRSLSSLSKHITSVKKNFGGIGENTKQISRTKKAVDEVANATERLNKAQKSVNGEQSKTLSEKDISKFNSNLGKFKDKSNDFSIKPDEQHRLQSWAEQIGELNKLIDEYAAKLKEVKVGDLVDQKEVVELESALNSVKEKISKMNKTPQGERGYTNIAVSKAMEKINSELEKFSGMSSKAKRRVKELYDEMKTGNLTKPIADYVDEVHKLIQEEREAKRAHKSFVDIIKEKVVYGAGAQIAGLFGIYDIINLGKQGFETVKEFNTALTEMRKVSDETVESLERFQSITFDTGDSVGATAKTIQNSTADFMRLGESLDESHESAKAANILLNVSEFESIDEATESLISMNQAYKELNKMEIIDVANKLGNEFAISTDGVATALKDSASALKTAQNDFYEASSLVTAANTVVQDPAKVGAGLRTIALRITGTESAREELRALGEDVSDFQVTTTSKLNQQIMDLTKTQDSLGVSLLDMNGNYRSTYDILLDIAKVWDTIAQEDLATGENRQNALLELMAGKNRANILASILQSPEVLEDAYTAATNADGSAQEELDKYLDSIDGKMTQLENRVQEFWFKLIDSDTIKNGITLLTELVEVGTNLVDTFGALPPILGALGSYTLSKSGLDYRKIQNMHKCLHGSDKSYCYG